MRQTVAFVFLFVAATLAWAQSPRVPAPTQYDVRFESQHGESFSVFLDGELQNRMPQGQVLVTGVSDQTHEVVVVLKRPADKAAVLQLRPGERTVTVKVSYDERQEKLSLFTAAHNRPERAGVVLTGYQPAVRRPNRIEPMPLQPAEGVGKEARVPDTAEVAAMVMQLKAQSFEKDRLALAKVLVAATPMTSDQIALLAATLDYSNSQVELLKYAYTYCLDPANYYRTVDVLTFSTDKKKVLDYIATQR